MKDYEMTQYKIIDTMWNDVNWGIVKKKKKETSKTAYDARGQKNLIDIRHKLLANLTNKNGVIRETQIVIGCLKPRNDS